MPADPRLVVQRAVQPLAQLAARKLGRVDDHVRLGADLRQQLALARDRRGNTPVVAVQRVPVARLAEAPDQDVVACLEEEDLGRDVARLERADGLLKCQRRVAARASSTSASALVACQARCATSWARLRSSSAGRLSTTL